MSKIFKPRTFRFTLIELIVSMAVFTLLSMVVIQLFSATQKLWSRSEGKNEVYQDAQMTLDLIDNMLTNISYATSPEQGTQLFRLSTSGNFSKLYFATKSNIDALPQNDDYKNPIRFVTFQVTEINNSSDPDYKRNCLVMRVLSDRGNDEATFNRFFPPTQSDNDALVSVLDTSISDNPSNQNPNVVRLLNNVIAFEVRFGASTTAIGSSHSFSFDELPAFVEVTLMLMDRNHYDDYMGLSGSKKSDYEAKYAHKFSRYIYFGRYRATEF